MSARELEQLRLRQQQLEAEVERLRQLVHEASARPSQTAQCSDSTAGLLKAILDSATDYAIFTTDEYGIVTSWNEGASRLFGWRDEEIVGQDGRVIFTPEDRETGAPESEMQAASAEGRAEDERWHLRKDGSRFWASGVLMPLRAEQPGFLKILRDGTDRRQHAAALRRSEALKAAILEAALDCIISIRSDSTIVEWNPAAERIFGYPAGGAIGQDIARLIIPPDFREQHYKGMAHYLATGHGPVLGRRVELEALRADGSRFPVELAITPTSVEGQPHFTAYLRDISERKAAEAALREGAERLRLSLAAGQLGEWELDLETDTSVRALRHDQIFGYDELVENWGFETFISHVLAEDRPHVEEKFRAAAETGSGWHFECRIRRANDGEIRWIAANSEPLRAADGRVVKIFGFLGDITERKTAEEQLKASQARLVALIESLPVGVCFIDQEGNTLLANPAFRGFLPEGVIPSRLPDAEERWISYDARGRRLSRHEFPASRALRGETVPGIEFLHRAADGRETWTRLSGTPLRDPSGRVTGAIAVIVDIDAEKRAQEALRRLNENLEQEVADRTAERDRTWLLSHDLLAVAGFDGRLKAINPAWSRVLGFDEATLLSTPFAELIHPDDLAAAGEAVGAMMRGQTTEHFEDRLRRVDGTYRTISWTAVPEGDVFYAIGRDVTEQRYTEEQLRQAQKMEAVGQLTGGVAHDFNNLLTIIRSSVEFLQRPNLSDERRQRYIEAISETVDRASKLTSQLLAFARRQALKPEVFDVSERIRSVRDMLRTVMGSRIQIVSEIACGSCFVEADMVQFETALVNMAVNARDAMDGQGRLTIRLFETSQIPALRAHETRVGRFAAVSLADTGSGITPDKLEHIFEPFFTTKAIGKGTGLGLSQVLGFAKQSGGDIGVESEVGHGTTFTLYLPQVDRSTAPAEPKRSADRAEVAEHGQGRRVLVVEDNIEVGQFSTQLLQDLGYETVWAANADEALRVLEAESARFDVVFSDVVMPGMSGVDLGHEIERRYPELPVVLTSGYSHVLAEEGPHGFALLHKPYAAEEVSRVLRQAMYEQGGISAPRERH